MRDDELTKSENGQSVSEKIQAIDDKLKSRQDRLNALLSRKVNAAETAAADKKPAEERDKYAEARKRYRDNIAVLNKKPPYYCQTSLKKDIAKGVFDVLFCLLHILTVVVECLLMINLKLTAWLFWVLIVPAIAITITECILAADDWTDSEDAYIPLAFLGYFCYIANIGTLFATAVIVSKTYPTGYKPLSMFPQKALLISVGVASAAAFAITLWRTIRHFKDSSIKEYIDYSKEKKQANEDNKRLEDELKKADELDAAWKEYDSLCDKARKDAKVNALNTGEIKALQSEIETLKEQKRDLLDRQQWMEEMLRQSQMTALKTAGLECEKDKDGTIIIIGLREDVPEIVIPEVPAVIADDAFAECYNLIKVTVGDGVTSIGDSAFADCRNLKSVSIGDGVEHIGEKAFYGCSGLTNITIGDGIKSIGSDAFPFSSGISRVEYNEFGNARYLGNKSNPYVVLVRAKNTALTACTIHNDTKIIYERAFCNYSKLISIEIPEGVKSIGRAAFKGCTGLTSVTLSRSTQVAKDAFDGCVKMKKKIAGNRAASGKSSDIDLIEGFVRQYVSEEEISDSYSYYDKRYGEGAFDNMQSMLNNLDDSYATGNLDDEYFEGYAASSITSLNLIIDTCKSGKKLNDDFYAILAHVMMVIEINSSILNKKIVEKLKQDLPEFNEYCKRLG